MTRKYVCVFVAVALSVVATSLVRARFARPGSLLFASGDPVSDIEAAKLVGGGIYKNVTYECGGWWCDEDSCTQQDADVYKGTYKRVVQGFRWCGNSWFGECGACLDVQPQKCTP
jgi:hypothetical protein